MRFTNEEEVDDDTSSPLKSPLKTLIYSGYDSEEDYCPEGTNKMDKALWERYYKQIKESEGFDITDYPGGCWMTTVFPMPNYLNNPKNVDKLKGYAGKALKQYNNSKTTNYEVENILKVNGGGCRDFIYYLTFSVKNGEHDIFQAKVVEDLDYNLEFPIIRLKVKDVNE